MKYINITQPYIYDEPNLPTPRHRTQKGQVFMEHKDFGNKIGGARKDTWAKRGLYSSDLASMNERETEKYVKKDNIWKKPNYTAMVQGGIPADVAYFYKLVRDSLPPKPLFLRSDNTPELRNARITQYIDTIRNIQERIEKIHTRTDAMAAFKTILLDGGFISLDFGNYFTPTEKGINNPVITNKLVHTLNCQSELSFKRYVTDKAKRLQFGLPKEQALPKGGLIRRYKEGDYVKGADDWQVGTYYALFNFRVIGGNFNTEAEALQALQSYAQSIPKKGRMKFTPPQLSRIRRNGPDYRNGKSATGDSYLETFGFYGGEFGNWMNQNDRQASLDMGFDALKDLASALNLQDKAISFNGVLSIAFGARGQGSAVAHYEGLRKVINLTKMRGAGSLAHEWWHGLDDFLGQHLAGGSFLSQRPQKYPAMQKLMDAIKWRDRTPEELKAAQEAATARTIKTAEYYLKCFVLQPLERAGDAAALTEYEALKTRFMQGEQESISQLSALKKRVCGRVVAKENRSILATCCASLAPRNGPASDMLRKAKSEYYTASLQMDKLYQKDGGYWASEVELTARAFATYILDKLPFRSDYLAGHAECAVGVEYDKDGNTQTILAYPTGEERSRINAAFDELFSALNKDALLPFLPPAIALDQPYQGTDIPA